jgi:hypothetical protein
VKAVQNCQSNRKSKASKKERYLDRQNLISKGKNSNNPEVRDAADRLEQDSKAIERANLSNWVYGEDNPPRPNEDDGWKKLDEKGLQELGLSPSDLEDPKTGFKAAIYQSNFEDPPKTVIAFAGTEDKLDVQADLTQGIGIETKQYNQASRLTSRVAKKLGERNVETTGHSLGGGLAAMGSVKSGCKSTTFNAAGLSPKTAEGLKVERETLVQHSGNIEAYNSDNDPLSIAQDNNHIIKGAITAAAYAISPEIGPFVGVFLADPDIIPQALGNRHVIPAAPENQLSWKDKILAPKTSALTGHGSKQMVKNIEHQKMEDSNKIVNDK